MISRKVLLITTVGGVKLAPLYRILHAAGLEVRVACPEPRQLKKVADKIYKLDYWRADSQLRRAIVHSETDYIIASNDHAVGLLYKIFHHDKGQGPIAEVIRRSLGNLDDQTLNKRSQTEEARKLGIRTPQTWSVKNIKELQDLTLPFPLVLKKTSGTCGGAGVRIVKNVQELEQAWKALSAPRSLKVDLLFPLLKHRNLQPLQDWFEWSNEPPLVQEYIKGTPAHRAVFCLNGQILAGTSVKALKTQGETGVAQAVELIDDPEMEEATRKLVRAKNFSGVIGVDYIHPGGFFIELNPRHIYTANLSFAGRTSPIAAFCANLLGTEMAASQTISERVVAYHPYRDMDDLIEERGRETINFHNPHTEDELKHLQNEENKINQWDSLYKAMHKYKKLSFPQKAVNAVRELLRMALS